MKASIPWFLVARLFLGGVFLFACADKILNPADFARSVYNYRLLPDGLISSAALFLPWLELFLGLCLIAGVFLPGAVFWTNGLLWVFFGALLINMIRGLDVHCGCFSTRPDPSGPPPMLWYLFRDFSFLLAGGFLFYRVFFSEVVSSFGFRVSGSKK